MSSSLKPA